MAIRKCRTRSVCQSNEKLAKLRHVAVAEQQEIIHIRTVGRIENYWQTFPSQYCQPPKGRAEARQNVEASN